MIIERVGVLFIEILSKKYSIESSTRNRSLNLECQYFYCQIAKVVAGIQRLYLLKIDVFDIEFRGY
jgi:hypothetical protein